MYVVCNKCKLRYDDTYCTTVCPHRGLDYCVACDCVVCTCPQDTLNERSNVYIRWHQDGSEIFEVGILGNTVEEDEKKQTLIEFLQSLGVKLEPSHISIIQVLESGKVISIRKVNDSVITFERYGIVLTELPNNPLLVNTGRNIIEDTQIFIQEVVPILTSNSLMQNLADQLTMYLKSRFYNDDEIRQIVSVVLQMQQQHNSRVL